MDGSNFSFTNEDAGGSSRDISVKDKIVRKEMMRLQMGIYILKYIYSHDYNRMFCTSLPLFQ